MSEAQGEQLLSVVHTRRGDHYVTNVRVGKHTLVADEPPARGGADAGPAPYGILLASLGACTSMTLVMYAEKKGWELGEVEVDLVMVRVGEEERVKRTIKPKGALSDEQRRRLLEIAEKTPVTKTLKRAVVLETTLG